MKYDDYGRRFYEHVTTGERSEEEPAIVKYKPPPGRDEDGNATDMNESDLDKWILTADGKGEVYYTNKETGKIVAKKIEWGDPSLAVKNDDAGRAASFWARHGCDKMEKMNPEKAGFWACYGPTLFGKQLGLKSDNPW